MEFSGFAQEILGAVSVGTQYLVAQQVGGTVANIETITFEYTSPTPITACGNFTQNGTYVLMNDINLSTATLQYTHPDMNVSACLNFQNLTSLVLDCGGYSLYGNVSSSANGVSPIAVQYENGANITMRNCVVDIRHDTSQDVYGAAIFPAGAVDFSTVLIESVSFSVMSSTLTDGMIIRDNGGGQVLNITGSTFRAHGGGSYVMAVDPEASAVLTMTGNYLEHSGGVYAALYVSFASGGVAWNNTINTTDKPYSQTGATFDLNNSVMGNIWVRPNGTGFSQTCVDSNNDSICDSPYDAAEGGGYYDYLPVALPQAPQGAPVDFTGFDGATTNFSAMNTLNLSYPVLEKAGYFKIGWGGGNLNFSGANLTAYVLYGQDWVDVLSASLPIDVNTSANVTVLGSYNSFPAVYADGVQCMSCVVLFANASEVKFSVLHFTNYSIVNGTINGSLTLQAPVNNSNVTESYLVNFTANLLQDGGTNLSWSCDLLLNGSSVGVVNVTANATVALDVNVSLYVGSIIQWQYVCMHVYYGANVTSELFNLSVFPVLTSPGGVNPSGVTLLNRLFEVNWTEATGGIPLAQQYTVYLSNGTTNVSIGGGVTNITSPLGVFLLSVGLGTWQKQYTDYFNVTSYPYVVRLDYFATDYGYLSLSDSEGLACSGFACLSLYYYHSGSNYILLKPGSGTATNITIAYTNSTWVEITTDGGILRYNGTTNSSLLDRRIFSSLFIPCCLGFLVANNFSLTARPAVAYSSVGDLVNAQVTVEATDRYTVTSSQGQLFNVTAPVATVTLNNTYVGSPVVSFCVERESILVGCTTNGTYRDVLPGGGMYNYTVVAGGTYNVSVDENVTAGGPFSVPLNTRDVLNIAQFNATKSVYWNVTDPDVVLQLSANNGSGTVVEFSIDGAVVVQSSPVNDYGLGNHTANVTLSEVVGGVNRTEIAYFGFIITKLSGLVVSAPLGVLTTRFNQLVNWTVVGGNATPVSYVVWLYNGTNTSIATQSTEGLLYNFSAQDVVSAQVVVVASDAYVSSSSAGPLFNVSLPINVSVVCTPITYPNEDNLPSAAEMGVNVTYSTELAGVAVVNVTASGVLVSSCSGQFCNVTVNYYSPFGNYSANATATVGSKSATATTGLVCEVAKLVAYQRVGDTVQFPTAAPGAANVPGDRYIQAKNTGNAALNLSVTAKNLLSRTSAVVLNASTFNVGASLPSSVQMQDNVNKDLAMSVAPGVNSTGNVGFWLSMPVNQPVQEYYTPNPWTLGATG
jgi:hypothetical protein